MESQVLIKSDVVWNNITGDKAFDNYGLHVCFRDVPENEWMGLISQGYSPAISIFYGNIEGNLQGRRTQGFTLYNFAISPYVT